MSCTIGVRVGPRPTHIVCVDIVQWVRCLYPEHARDRCLALDSKDTLGNSYIRMSFVWWRAGGLAPHSSGGAQGGSSVRRKKPTVTWSIPVTWWSDPSYTIHKVEQRRLTCI